MYRKKFEKFGRGHSKSTYALTWEGVHKKVYERVHRGGGLFKERTNVLATFKWYLLGNHPRLIKLAFKDCKRKIAFSAIFMQKFDSTSSSRICIKFCKLKRLVRGC